MLPRVKPHSLQTASPPLELAVATCLSQAFLLWGVTSLTSFSTSALGGLQDATLCAGIIRAKVSSFTHLWPTAPGREGRGIAGSCIFRGNTSWALFVERFHSPAVCSLIFLIDFHTSGQRNSGSWRVERRIPFLFERRIPFLSASVLGILVELHQPRA